MSLSDAWKFAMWCIKKIDILCIVLGILFLILGPEASGFGTSECIAYIGAGVIIRAARIAWKKFLE